MNISEMNEATFMRLIESLPPESRKKYLADFHSKDPEIKARAIRNASKIVSGSVLPSTKPATIEHTY